MQGSLAEFTLGELLQLFALSEKTGSITVSTDQGCSQLHLEVGRVRGWGTDAFDVHSAILACELLPPTTASALENLTPQPDQPGLGFIIKNLVEPYRWRSFVQRNLEQDIYPILNIENGEFEITIDAVDPAPVRVDISVQQLVLDGSRWEADMMELSEAGFGLDSSWNRTAPGADSGALELSRLEWLVWSLLTHPASAGEVARRICAPDLETCHAIRRLASNHLLIRAGE